MNVPRIGSSPRTLTALPVTTEPPYTTNVLDNIRYHKNGQQIRAPHFTELLTLTRRSAMTDCTARHNAHPSYWESVLLKTNFT